ncbi:glycosyltransferase family 2 protein [Chitinophaga sp. S165]|uniref:glycosyltransferase family 2 protein n=1 Tax=Chitinophaga sp. S165 TaxID=2135462 RepID=UPI000D7119C8|nr:glycosyltransferase family 2 protein [Chitinophaga sp. S165]PWV53543.1 glycosyltransferase involved in cell wall biosynthesis [Chitinophaga sp. S165]
MQKGLVSIITPVYNAGRFVHETIESVMAQTYPHWEMILVDDGSKDNSAEIIRSYVQKDSRIQLFSQPNGGSAAARNNGIRRAAGQYIALLDADDLWNNNFLESQLALMKKHDACLVYGSHRRIDEHSKECMRPFIVPEKVNYDSLLKTCSISCLTGLYDITQFGKMYLREDLRSLRDDYVYWLEILKKCKVAYGNKEIIASYRVLSNSTSGKKKKVIKPQFLVYYKIEKLGLLRSIYYLIHWAVNGYSKYRA